MVVAAPTIPRRRIAAMDSGPGPSKYLLPGSCGHMGHDLRKRKSPAFSFGARRKYTESMASTSPGPAGYFVPATVVRMGKDGSPAYSLYSRPKNGNSFKTPAPASYYAEQCHPQGEPQAPSYSFGVRTQQHQKQLTPSPNVYVLPSLLGSTVIGKSSSASYSMRGRSQIGSFHEDKQKTHQPRPTLSSPSLPASQTRTGASSPFPLCPGPGTYRIVQPAVTKQRMPSYSINGRHAATMDSAVSPGPGAYSPEKVVIAKPLPPSFSFGVRHSPYLSTISERISVSCH